VSTRDRLYQHRQLVLAIEGKERLLAALKEHREFYSTSVVTLATGSDLTDERITDLMVRIEALETEIVSMKDNRMIEEKMLKVLTDRLAGSKRLAMEIYFYQGLSYGDAALILYNRNDRSAKNMAYRAISDAIECLNC
jgi:hypothetical protein